LYASYVIHLTPQADFPQNEFARVAVYDEILDALADTPAIYGCVLAEAVHPVEAYLRLRPERYEQIARFAREGRLEFGPWYVDTAMHSLEMTIRNLQMGVQTLKLLGAPLVTALLPPEPSPQMPQILRGFGIDSAFMENTETGRVTGLDGSTLNVFPAGITDLDHARSSASGRHLMLRVSGSPSDWITKRDELAKTPDDVFLSNRASMLSAAQAGEAIRVLPGESVPGIGESSAEKMLVEELEPAIVRAAYSNSAPLRSPQRILQTLWRDVLAAGDVARLNALLEIYGSDATQLFEVESDGFTICAVKLREDGQAGVILRGYNASGQAHRVRLRAWRDFTHCAVVRLDESRTGAGLPITDGWVEFTSNPHRITTLCFLDDQRLQRQRA
jgi:hypothetical protein